jgi:DNA repair exonuclease SbcCD ATPase subunit
MLKTTHESVLNLKEIELKRELAKIKRLQNQIYRQLEEIKYLKNELRKLNEQLENKRLCWDDDYKLFKSISEENKKYKLQIDTIEALKKQFKKEIDISFKRGEAITEEDIKFLLRGGGANKLVKLYQLLGLM